MAENGTRPWGPFTGRQLTIIIVALFATVVLVPTAVYAVPAAKSVIIQDGTNPANKVSVSGGKLNVGDGSGPLTVDGIMAVGDGVGPLTVDGSVSASAAQPSEMLSIVRLVTQGGSLFTPPAGKALVVTAITINQSAGPFGTVFVQSSPAQKTFLVVTPTALGPLNFTFPTGTVLREGDTMTMSTGGTGIYHETAYWVTIAGYYVPASACQAGSNCGY